MRLAKNIILITLICIFYLFNTCYADNIKTQISREKIAFGETVTINFILDSQYTANKPDFAPLQKDFRILSTNYGNAMSVVNGVASSQTFWRVTITPKGTGELVIPEINFGNVTSAPRKLVVIDNATDSMADNANNSTFLKEELSSKNPYLESQVVYTFKLYYQSQLDNPRIDIPQIKDVKIVELKEGAHYQTSINGKDYLVVEKNFALYPQKTGKIDIPAFRFAALSPNLNLNMMDDPFFIREPTPINLRTKDFSLMVRDIPNQFQSKNWLPANDISLTEKWSVDPSQWEVDNPVIRTIKVEADGLRADQIPDLKIDTINGANIYIDPPKRYNKIKQNSVTGILEQKVTYIPTDEQSIMIPTIKLPWWNLQTDRNDISQLNSMIIFIKGKINKTQTKENQTPLVNAIDKELNTSKSHEVANDNKISEQGSNKVGLFYLSIWFWVAIVSFLIWFMTIWFIWRKKRTVHSIVDSTEINNQVLKKSEKFNIDDFKKACMENDANSVHQLLLTWAQKEWQEEPLNLEKLRKLVDDEDLKNEINNLEQTLYAKKSAPWNGANLLTAYMQIKKRRKYSLKNENNKKEILPPLNPIV